jgi:hypothetical protein
MRLRLFAVLILLLTGGLLAACGQGSGTPTPADSGSSAPGEPSTSASPSTDPSAPPAGNGIASGEPAPGPTAQGADLTITGQVEQGVEAGCVLLKTDGKTYNLLGGDKNILKAGNKVTVRGQVATGVMSYCMQGESFQVAEARLS